MSISRALCLAAITLFAASAQAATGKIVKVLPHFLDKQGRHTLHPSLFERDEYQSQLRRTPELRSTMRFDIQWKAKNPTGPLRLRVEARGKQTPAPKPLVLERELPKASRFSKWTPIPISPAEFAQLGEVVAWRVSLWDGEQLVAEQKSFLW